MHGRCKRAPVHCTYRSVSVMFTYLYTYKHTYIWPRAHVAWLRSRCVLAKVWICAAYWTLEGFVHDLQTPQHWGKGVRCMDVTDQRFHCSLVLREELPLKIQTQVHQLKLGPSIEDNNDEEDVEKVTTVYHLCQKLLRLSVFCHFWFNNKNCMTFKLSSRFNLADYFMCKSMCKTLNLNIAGIKWIIQHKYGSKHQTQGA